MQSGGRPGEAPLVGHGKHVLELAQLHGTEFYSIQRLQLSFLCYLCL